MRNPATHGGAAVEHIETHISHVFLAGDLAFKMKKEVKLDFVDFSSLEKRRVACEAELRVNARTARALYIDVVAVNATERGLGLGPPAAPVEYLVRMHRFAQDDLLDRIAARHALDLHTVRQFADAVAGLHLNAEPLRSGSVPERFWQTLADLATRLGQALPQELRPRFEAWHCRIADAARALEPRLAARARRKAVRHGHGDLHLRNACRLGDEVVLFDAIEFEPRFSHVDVLYDAAFAVMDLRHRSEDLAATAFLGRYLSATRDYGDLAALRVFLSARAGVRLLVCALSASDEAEAYLTLAEASLAPPSPPRLVGVGGRSGSGKSTLALAIAPRLGTAPDVVILRSDELRKRMLGRPPDAVLGPAAYGADVTDAVYRRLLRDARRALRAGGSVIADATHLDDGQRAALQSLAQAEGVRFDGIWLSAREDVLRERLLRRGADASDADASVMRAQPDVAQVAGWQAVPTEGDLAATTGVVLAALGLRPDGATGSTGTDPRP